MNGSVVSSSVLLLKSHATGSSPGFTVTVMVTVAAADSSSSESMTVKVKLAVPFQSATGSNTSLSQKEVGAV